MLTAYRFVDGYLRTIDTKDGQIPPEAAWIDLLQPAIEEDISVEKLLNIEIPTREEMGEIELSNRLYVEHGARYMTTSLLCNTDLGQPKLTPVTFILIPNRLVTVRYETPKPFQVFPLNAHRLEGIDHSPTGIMAGLLDTVVDRLADILEKAGEEIEQISTSVFSRRQNNNSRSADYEESLQMLGFKGDLVSKVRESLVSLGRLFRFLTADIEGAPLDDNARINVKSQARDIESLTQHCDAQSAKITFLLDAILGLVQIEQNHIVKIFAVLSVVFMPPTLVASIYGMNFKSLPELNWDYGYPMALLVMLFVGAGPYFYFRWKRWL